MGDKTELELLREENERFTVQMAGITTAAEGGTANPATSDEWGWSVPYQRVLELRRKYDNLLKSRDDEKIGLPASPATFNQEILIKRCNQLEEKMAAIALILRDDILTSNDQSEPTCDTTRPRS